MSTPNFEVVQMTPEWAQHLLSNQNGHNRKIKTGHVASLTESIKRGEWKLTSQGIAIGTNGQLLDGQHRLTAIRDSGQAVPVLLATECDPSIFTVIDTGSKRTAGDTLYLLGAPQHHQAAAAIRLIMLAKQYKTGSWANGKIVISNEQIQQYYLEDQLRIDTYVRLVYNSVRNFKLVNRGALTAFCILALDKQHFKNTVDNFVEALTTGANLPHDSAVLAFRNAIVNRSIFGERGGTTVQQLWVSCLTKCFNDWYLERSLKVFKAPKQMPEIAHNVFPA